MPLKATSERKMPGEDRIAGLESDMRHVRSTAASSESRVQAIDAKIDGVRNDLHSFKTEVATLFGAVRGEIANLRTDIIEKLGNLKIWVLLTAAGTAGSLISLLLNVASVIRGWQSH